MKTTFLPIDAGLQEWRRLTGHEGTINEQVIRANLSNAVEQFITDEQFGYKVALLTIRGRKTKLPADYEILCLAAANTYPDKYINRGHMVNWVYKACDDCELEINLNCHGCKKPNCQCSRPVVVEVDKLFREEHPEFQVNKWRHFAGVSRPTTDGFPIFNSLPQFRLLTPFHGQSALWNTTHYVGDCPNLGLQSCPGFQFEIENGYIITDFDNGQILLGYLGHYRDENGYMMIPNTTSALEACVWFAQARELYRRYLIALEPPLERAWRTAEELATIKIGQAREELQIPSAEDWTALFKRIWEVPDHKHYYIDPYAD